MLEREGEAGGGEASGGFQVLSWVLLMFSHPCNWIPWKAPNCGNKFLSLLKLVRES